MKIVVCIKQIDFLYFHYGVDTKVRNIDSEKLVPMINPCDEAALEEAIRIKESLDDVEITVMTLGSESTEPFLRYAFAFGADKMVRLEGLCLNPLDKATALCNAISERGYDLILCGEKSLDRNNQLVGTLIAEKLDLPQVSGIVSLKLNPLNKNAIVERKVGKGDREIIECELPALFTTAVDLNDPRYPTLPGRLRAKQAEITKISIQNRECEKSDPACGPMEVCLLPLNPRPKPIFTPAPSLSAYERMQQVIKGDPTEKKGIVIKGDPQDIAGSIVKILRQHGYLMYDKPISSDNDHSNEGWE